MDDLGRGGHGSSQPAPAVRPARGRSPRPSANGMLSVVRRTLAPMTTLSTVPEWVRLPPPATVCMEGFLLRLYGRTKSPEVLGAWACLDWLGGWQGERTRGPLTRRGLPTEAAARGDMQVASAIAEGATYPSPTWWDGLGIAVSDRMPAEEWATRIASEYERHYCHGVRVAFGWLLGVVDDAALLAPIRDGEGARIPAADRDAYRRHLREIAQFDPGPEVPGERRRAIHTG